MKSKKLLALIGCALGGLMLAGTALAAAYHTEDQKMTIGSLRRIDKHGYLYEVDYKADYKLDEILAAEPLTVEACKLLFIVLCCRRVLTNTNPCPVLLPALL